MIDKITEVNKNIDEIEHIEKFNPFHDSRGRFSSSNGMASYSANPKTKAGQLAIGRSTAAGYGAVMNVHRESKGENIRQNDSWIRSGQKPNKSQLARAQANAPKTVAQARQNAHTNRVKGTMGATETAQAKHPARPKAKPAQAKQPQQAQQQNQQTAPKGLKASVANVKVAPHQQSGIQQRNRWGHTPTVNKVANDHDQVHVKGNDISKSFSVNHHSNTRAIDQVAKAQGWNKGATVTNDWDTFQKAAVKSGQLLIRSVDGYGSTTAEDVCKTTMTNGNAALGGHGGKVYGGGMYCVGAATTTRSNYNSLSSIVNKSQSHSYAYGDTQMMATVHPSAKIAKGRTLSKLQNEYHSSGASSNFKDIGAFIAAKGYDGAQWHSKRSDPYITMYNKSAMIFYGGVSKAY